MKEVASLDKSKKSAGAIGKKTTAFRNPLIAFFLTAFCYIALVAMSRVYPFGDHSILLSDLEAQYAPFLFLYRSCLRSANSIHSLTYSFTMGMGKNMMATYGYYLASPFNFLVLLFSPAQVSEFITVLIVLKLSLSSAFMCLFLEKRSTISTRWPIMFGVVYAFSSFVMIFMFNIMWLDGYMLLPLVLFFTENYMHTGKRLGLTISLLVLFLSNYYIAYMVGIYVFFYLLFRMYTEGMFKDKKSSRKLISKFILTAVMCALVLCVIILPVGLDTLKNADPTHKNSTESYVGFSMVDIVDQFFLGEQGEFLSHNMPYLFMSLAVTTLCVIFFVSKSTPTREKKIYGIVFGAVYLVLAINALDVAWQAFDAPNWFFHREVFVFYPLFLVVALKTLERIKEVTGREFLISLGILEGLIFFAQSFGGMKEKDTFFLYNMFAVAALIAIFALMKRTKWPEQLRNMPTLLPFMLALITVSEVSFIGPVLSAGLSIMSMNTSDARLYASSINAISQLASADYPGKDGFRMELEQFSTVENTDGIDDVGAFYADYNGVSFFNSNSNKQLHRFLKQFGYTVNYDYFSEGYGYTAPDTDAFLSIGGVMTRSEYSNGNFIVSDTYGDGLNLYANGEVLPLAFSAPLSAYDFDFYSLERASGEKDYFSFRNNWFNSLFPEEFDGAEYFAAPETELVPEYINCSVIDTSEYMGSGKKDEDESQSNTDEDGIFDYDDVGDEIEASYRDDITHVYRINDSIPMIISYDITVEREDELYINVSNARCLNDCSIYVNGEYLAGWTDGSFYSPIARLGAFEVGEEINVSIVSDGDLFNYVDINFAYFDHDLFAERFASVEKSDVQVVSVNGGDVVISADLKEGDTILTTIPYEGGWTLTVDGVEQEIKAYQGALIGIDCGSGSHEIHLTFTPPGMKKGAVASCIGVIGLIGLALSDRITPKKKAQAAK